MSRKPWWTLVAALTLALPGAAWSAAPRGHKLMRKCYAVADLAIAPERLVYTVQHAVEPSSWRERGGPGTMEYRSKEKLLLVRQTAAVHKQIGSVLKALATVRPCVQTDAPQVLPAAYSARSTASDHRKQYGHFVLDNLRVNAMGVSCTVKRIRFQYKGDGIDGDVAKCALTNGESEKKADLPQAFVDALEKLGKAQSAPAKTTVTKIGAAGVSSTPPTTPPSCLPALTCQPKAEKKVEGPATKPCCKPAAPADKAKLETTDQPTTR